jgi:hypothetical protein
LTDETALPISKGQAKAAKPPQYRPEKAVVNATHPASKLNNGRAVTEHLTSVPIDRKARHPRSGDVQPLNPLFMRVLPLL